MADKLIDIHPVPECCGAAVLTNFGGDYSHSLSETRMAEVKARFDKVIDDFEKGSGEFSSYGNFENYVDEIRARAYYARSRSSLLIYLNDYQVRHFRSLVCSRGFTEVFNFKNKNSGQTVTMFAREKDL